MSLKLTVKNKNEITLPGGLAASPLTLAEIGAITCMACLETPQENEDGIAARLQSRWQKLMCCLKTECGPIPPNHQAQRLGLKNV